MAMTLKSIAPDKEDAQFIRRLYSDYLSCTCPTVRRALIAAVWRKSRALRSRLDVRRRL
jgi:hypothetical protein